MLWDSFQHSVCDVFTDQIMDTCENLGNYTITVLNYISCVDNVISWKQFCIFPNMPTWMTHQVQQLVRTKNSAFSSGDQEVYSNGRAALRRGINAAKATAQEAY